MRNIKIIRITPCKRTRTRLQWRCQEHPAPCEFSVRNLKRFLTENSDKSPAIESSDQTKAAKHEPLVYRVEEIAQLLAISPRAAYNLCNTTKDFRMLRIGTSIRVNKQSFDSWFAAV